MLKTTLKKTLLLTEIQGDIRPSEEEEEMKREVQGEMIQEKEREITEEGAAEADIEYQVQGSNP